MEQPRATYRFSTRAVGWWTVLFWNFGSKFAVEVPVCESCRTRIRRQRLQRLAATWIFAMAGVGIALYLMQSYHGPFKQWILMGIALTCLLPLCLWETFSPPPLDLTAYSDSVDYEFRDAAYAEEFADLNQRVWEKEKVV